MTYRETLDYLVKHLPMYQRIGTAAYKKDLSNIYALAERLGNPQHQFATVHIGGTNGKGSVSHMLAAACQAAGLKTGLYISPHYKDIRERIKINGKYIPKKRVMAFVEEHAKFIDELEPSFFEMCVAMAFDHFAREKVDIAIIEVGLGGRIDSTNIITPLLSVITNISFDHVNLLGNTIGAIAEEKAGIIKAGIPVVIGETHPESAPVFLKTAKETASPIVFADQHYSAVEVAHPRLDTTVYRIEKDGKVIFEALTTEAAGPYQQKNVQTAAQAWELLFPMLATIPGVQLPADITQGTALCRGLGNLKSLVRFMGRWQLISQNPTVLADSAHNEAGLRSAFERIESFSFKTLHIVSGYVNDKDLTEILPLFPKNARYYFAKADIPRGLEADLLRDEAAKYQLYGKAYKSVRNALQAAKRAAGENDLVVVIGSIFIVAEVLPNPK